MSDQILEDLDHEVVCDGMDCGGRAAWRLISPCCRHVWLSCDECKVADEYGRALVQMMGVLLRCVKCDRDLPHDLHWVSLQ